MKLPVLSKTEYIKKVVVIPMGLDGNTEGELPSLNSFWVNYKIKSSAVDGTFPDGTPVGNKQLRASTQWKLLYARNENAPNSYPENVDLNIKDELVGFEFLSYLTNSQ